MKTPSIPPSFWKALATAILFAAAAAGLPLSPRSQHMLGVIAETLPVAIIAGGTIIHAARAAFAPNVLHAKAVQAAAEAAAIEAAHAVEETVKVAEAANASVPTPPPAPAP